MDTKVGKKETSVENSILLSQFRTMEEAESKAFAFFRRLSKICKSPILVHHKGYSWIKDEDFLEYSFKPERKSYSETELFDFRQLRIDFSEEDCYFHIHDGTIIFNLKLYFHKVKHNI
jgi:hypothetical protein